MKLPNEGETVHVMWEGALPPKEKDLQTDNPFDKRAGSRYNADKVLISRLGIMKNALLDFTVGTAGALPAPTVKKRKKKGKKKATPMSRKPTSKLLHTPKSESKLERLVMSEIAKLLEEQDTTAKEQKPTPELVMTPRRKYVLPFRTQLPAILTEELKLPELMLPAVSDVTRLPVSLRDQESSKQRVCKITDKKFITTHLAGITRKDQFNKILDFDRNILHRYETTEQNVRDGHKAVEHLEQKLVRRLLRLEQQEPQVYGLNFERLQVYGEVWQDLCVDSSYLGPLFSNIKAEYDTYLSDLLDEMKLANHTELVACLNTVDNTNIKFATVDVEEMRTLVEDLEEESRRTLLQNAELQNCIARETARIGEERKQRELEEEDNRRRMLPSKTVTRKTTAPSTERRATGKTEKNTEARLKDLRADIWERLDEISQVRNKLQTKFVPKCLYRNLLHAVQDTENDMQKLMQQNEYLTKNTSVQEQLLEGEITRFDSMNAESLKEFWSELGLR